MLGGRLPDCGPTVPEIWRGRLKNAHLQRFSLRLFGAAMCSPVMLMPTLRSDIGVPLAAALFLTGELLTRGIAAAALVRGVGIAAGGARGTGGGCGAARRTGSFEGT